MEEIEEIEVTEMADNSNEALSVLILKDKVLFPGTLTPITLTRTAAKQLVKDMYTAGETIAVVCQKEKKTINPGWDDIFHLGVEAKIRRVLEMPGNRQMVMLEAINRVELTTPVSTEPYLRAKYLARPDIDDANDPEMDGIVSVLKETITDLFRSLDNMPDGVIETFINLSSPQLIINHGCCNMQFDITRTQLLLEIDSLKQRAVTLQKIIMEFSAWRRIEKDVKTKTQQALDKNQREYYLTQQMRTIQDELGDSSAQEIRELEEKAKTKKWSQSVQARFDEELKRLERIGTHSPEYPTQRNYLDVMLSLPWEEMTEDNYDLKHAQKVLNQDHFGMEQVKERILEYLACSKHDGMILCLYGPPGVGKTSLGKSIAKALGRKYARISLGGLHDEAEIRGHRKTYIGAMPGRIIHNLEKVGSSNPVFVLDEIDKICADYHGDPTSALLEVLDPQQNKTFHDNFLDIDYDLSKVLFIATANTLSTVPRPLLDRMELIEMTGYLQEEKEAIAKHYLIPRQLKEQNLKSSDLRFSAKALHTLIDDYTRESGVRELERQVASVVRKVLKRRALDEPTNALLQPDDIHSLLGKPRYSRDRYEGNEYPGVVTGLAWTQVGGEILFIETLLATNKTPTLTLTGNLGDVMKESATIALSYVKSHAADFGIPAELFDTQSVHIHVPEGAIPKDGPSAGITMTTAIVSAFTGRKVRAKLAMTGEMTLRGKVLPVGGIKEKILAAKRAGITDIILCHENEKDILEIPENYLKGLTFHYVHDIHEVIAYAIL
ncbi:MAG: endopeptidase La [Paludibacteraceae bacterium]|nr:endopeptidase La [Paludibacteraceae bacterium]